MAGVARRGGGLGASDQILGSSGFFGLRVFDTVSYVRGVPLGHRGYRVDSSRLFAADQPFWNVLNIRVRNVDQ